MRRILAFALVLSMLATVPYVPGTSLASEGAAKVDLYLAEALAGNPEYTRWADADGRYEVLFSADVAPLPEVAPATRAAWNAYWQAHAEPFWAAVRAALQPGDVWVSEAATVPLVKVKATPQRILEIAGIPQVRGAALDWPEAVQLLDEGSQGPGVAMGQSVGMTGAFDLHALGFYGQGVKLAVIDTGILSTHEMLLDEFGASRVVGWFDATTSPGGAGYCATACDANGHGTHVGTTAAGSDIAGGRHQGVAPRAVLYGVRIFQGGGGTWEVAQAGLQKAFDMGVDLTTNSWGGGCGGATGGGTITEKLAQTLALAGLQHIFAAGNSGPGSQGEFCPGRNDYVVSVGATDKNKVIAGFSSGGLCPDATGAKTRICPDVSAVGVNVEAGWNNGGYNSISGTSMATPHVAGGAVLMYQLNKALQDSAYNVPLQQLEQFFEANAEDLGAAGNDQRYGWGFIRLSQMGTSLLDGAQARATVDVSVAKSEMRNRDTNTVNVMVNNVGPRAISGTVRVTAGGILEHDGATYVNVPVNLAPGESTVVAGSIPGADLDPTTYHVVGHLDYTYTAADGSTQGTTIEDRTTFILRGVKMGVTRSAPVSSGWGREMYMGNGTTVTLTLRNIGNEPATNVDLTESVPLGGFVLVPSVTATDAPLGVLSSPAPNEVALNTDDRALDLSYAPSSVNPGVPYSLRYQLRAGVPGTWGFGAHVSFTDAVGDAYEQSLSQSQTVTCYARPLQTVPPLSCPQL